LGLQDSDSKRSPGIEAVLSGEHQWTVGTDAGAFEPCGEQVADEWCVDTVFDELVKAGVIKAGRDGG